MSKTAIARFCTLSFYLAKTGFKLRNEGSVLGVLWYLLNPILLFSLLWVIFADRLGQNIDYYPLYIFLGVIMFNFFQYATSDATTIVRQYRYLIQSINFPKITLVSSIILKFLFSHIFEIVFLAGLIIWLKSDWLALSLLLLYPLSLIWLAVFTFGICLILGSVAVYFIDTEHIWDFASRLLWFGTPLFYALPPESNLYIINLFNPLYYFITTAREMVIYGQLPAAWLWLGMAGFSLSTLIIGWWIFAKLEIKFAERV